MTSDFMTKPAPHRRVHLRKAVNVVHEGAVPSATDRDSFWPWKMLETDIETDDFFCHYEIHVPRALFRH